MPGIGSFRISAFRQKGTPGRSRALHPGRSAEVRQPWPSRGPQGSHHGQARPHPDGGRDRLRKIDDPGSDARLPQRAEIRPYPHHRGSGRVHLPEQEMHREPARGRHRYARLQDRAQERPAPGAGLHPDRRSARQGVDDRGDPVCAVGAPVPGDAARQQQLSRPEPDHQLLPAGESPRAAGGPVGDAEVHHLAAPDPQQAGPAQCRGRSVARQPPHRGTDRQGRNRRDQGSHGEEPVAGFADLRAMPFQHDSGREDQPGRGPRQCRLGHATCSG